MRRLPKCEGPGSSSYRGPVIESASPRAYARGGPLLALARGGVGLVRVEIDVVDVIQSEQVVLERRRAS